MDLSELVEIRLPDDEAFLKIRETLTRIGVASKQSNTLFQSCHILHKRGLYYIVHFKQMFLLDGKPTNYSEDDKGRLNTIVDLLAQWKLCEVVNPDQIKSPRAAMNHIKVIPYKDKAQWSLVAKYTIGRRA